MAVNESLLQSARRMYRSMYMPESKAWIGQIAKSAENAVSNIAAAVEQKRAENEAEFKVAEKSLLNEMKDNKISRDQFEGRLRDLKDQYDQASRMSTRVFGNKELKSDAKSQMQDVLNSVERYTEDIDYVDQYLKTPTNSSKANNLGDQIDQTYIASSRSVEDLIYKDDGVYVMNHLGEEVRLSKFKPPMQVWNEGIDTLSQSLELISANADKRGWEEDMAKTYRGTLNKIVQNKNFKSVLFDDIDDFNWAVEEIKERNEALPANEKIDVDDDDAMQRAIEVLRNEYDENPEKFKKLFIEDMMEVGKERHTENKTQGRTDGGGADKNVKVFNSNYNSYPFTQSGIKAEYSRGKNLKNGETIPWIFHPKVKGAEAATVTFKDGTQDVTYTMPDGSKVTKKGPSKKTYILTRPSGTDATQPIVKEYDSWEALWNAESGFENPGQYAGAKLPE